METFDGGKPAHLARRGGQRDAIASGKHRNDADGSVFPTLSGFMMLKYLNKRAGLFL